MGLPPQARGIEPDPTTGLAHLFGVGLHHPRASLLVEADAVPVAWLARVRCTAFWFRILSNPLYEGRILRIAAMEAMECGGLCIMKLQECLKSFGWCGVGAGEVRGLSSV